MAAGATIYVFNVDLADADRGIYQPLEIRAALHPSEAEDYLLTRVLAYCLEYREGIAFSGGGVSDRDEPTLYARELSGVLSLWVEIGMPSAERLHLASKSAPRVALYCHKDPRHLEKLREAGIHRAEEIAVYALDPAFLAALQAQLSRRMSFSLTVTEGHLYCSAGGASFDTGLQRISLGPA